jgi:hypothetical protein
MRAIPSLILLAGALAAAQVAPAQDVAVPDDTRQLVTMPPIARTVMREDMIDHLGALNEILGLMAADKLREAGEVAEKRMGRSTMGRHAARTRGQGPGRFMPPEMHGIGMAGHDAASEFAKVAATGDKAKALAALQALTSICVACHASYRTR